MKQSEINSNTITPSQDCRDPLAAIINLMQQERFMLEEKQQEIIKNLQEELEK